MSVILLQYAAVTSLDLNAKQSYVARKHFGFSLVLGVFPRGFWRARVRWNRLFEASAVVCVVLLV